MERDAMVSDSKNIKYHYFCVNNNCRIKISVGVASTFMCILYLLAVKVLLARLLLYVIGSNN